MPIIGWSKPASPNREPNPHLSHLVVRPKPDAHRMCAQDQDFTHTARITTFQIKPVSKSEYAYYNSSNSILSYYSQDLNTTLAKTQHTTGSWEVGTPARRALHQGTPLHHHLLNSIISMESATSMSTLMVGTPQGYNHGEALTGLSRKHPKLKIHCH
jgi:hypothetical protein